MKKNFVSKRKKQICFICWCNFQWYLIDGVYGVNATFNNISLISWRSVLLIEETGENHRPVAGH